ncbi:helix-turn-helix domain-containing protein [Flavobacterium muglaense]|uniref:Helix-turn-helix transcriptional regulator n=1 Tax=Flavobacterium muglaense TaxID=2764716 RepID=A0A923MYX7_9FLAO|nr:AraC family transcriptional regulator [Flavobacterium muglaense]MBC5837176.1 helix-turn-helix transcriptional regulator [Flavobacterium muglaense]MBC5843705.1 helix-turn-helix transcriptional regulator [Flavobacterium muglaense]
MVLYIKNMVCDRCIMVVKAELQRLAIPYKSVALGEVVFETPLDATVKQDLATKLIALGFELIANTKDRTVTQIKNLIIQLVHYQQSELKVNLSQYLVQELSQDYNSLSQQFSEQEATTIEQYYILQRIEKVKELLRYKELSLSEIAFKLHFTDVAHLSNQFKKVTGVTPTVFKKIKENNRKQIDTI